MKKLALIAALSMAALLCACGSKQTENVQTEAAAQSADSSTGGPAADAKEQSKPTTIVELPDEYEPEFFEGVITDFTGALLTIEGSDGTKSFDISKAETSNDSPLIRGCYVEVSYADAEKDGVYPSDTVSILLDNEQLAEEELRDPIIYGVLQHSDVNELVIIDDSGREVDFDNAISRIVAFNDLKSGDEVIVTYCGELNSSDDEESEGIFGGVPFAIKVVALDAAKTDDAVANYIDGTVDSITDKAMILSTEIADFECSGDSAVLGSVSENDKVRVYYTGALDAITISVEKIEKR